MRLDKFLKISRLIKRRTVANDACSGGRVHINNKVAKAGTTLKIDDIVSINYGNKKLIIKVLALKESVSKEQASALYEIIGEE